MKENKLEITIERPVGSVFEFTTNPKKTHLWIPFVKEERSTFYPPEIGTIYQNRGENPDWTSYVVKDFWPNKIFTLADSEDNYHVQYTYKKLDLDKTKMQYFEWMENGELKDPFVQGILFHLKYVMEHEFNLLQ